MLPERHRSLNEDPCPVADHLLGDLYRASPHGLNELVATIPAEMRARLAIYCFGRAHLSSIALAIATTCEEDDLTSLGGNAGVSLFARSRETNAPVAHTQGSRRPSITLAKGLPISLPPLVDEEEEEDVA